jgi:hypothetical protein
MNASSAKDNAGETVLAPIDIAEEQVVGTVSEAAPDNQTLASIADKIVPKVSGTANAAVTRLSKEIPCPFDADDEKLNDEKLLLSLDEEPEHDEEDENEKTELIVRPDMDQFSSLDQLEIKIDEMAQMARKSLSGLEPSQEKGEKKVASNSKKKKDGKIIEDTICSINSAFHNIPNIESIIKVIKKDNSTFFFILIHSQIIKFHLLTTQSVVKALFQVPKKPLK